MGAIGTIGAMKSRIVSCAMVLTLSLGALSVAYADSATWSTNPISSDWNTAQNWTPNTVPNGPHDTATFDASNITDISFSDVTEVEGIVFNPGAGAFTINATQPLTISGTGITNNSGVTQTFVADTGPVQITFTHAATAGSHTTFINTTRIEFNGRSTAGTANFVTSHGGITIFFDDATPDSGTFVTDDGGTTFPGKAGNATLITNRGGTTYFGFDDRAENATLIANGGGVIIFDSGSVGGNGPVEVFGNGLLYLPDAFGISLGSIEGDGKIELGDFALTVGSNNLSTVFGGLLKDDVTEGGGGTLKKVGSGTLTLSSKNTYSGGTVVLEGTLILASEIASATGSGSVNVKGGTLSGTGTIYGAVTVGTGSGFGANLDPGNGTIPGTLTIQKPLTLHADAACTLLIDSNTPTSDQVTARGIRIRNASVLFQDAGTALLPSGTTFTVINNIGATRIKGTFSNLADGSTVTIGNNTFQASYEGGDGNDLTLTVVP
jgi:autotransporter-associated beta strand protein